MKRSTMHWTILLAFVATACGGATGPALRGSVAIGTTDGERLASPAHAYSSVMSAQTATNPDKPSANAIKNAWLRTNRRIRGGPNS